MHIALYQPDIAGNCGTILRLGACLGVNVHIIEPCGFPLGDRQLKRAAMDYGALATVVRHNDWDEFYKAARAKSQRLILLSSKAEESLYQTEFQGDDILIMGSESAGVPELVRDQCDISCTIPMQPGFRSLNIAVASGIALGEALRQTRFGHKS